MARKPLSQPTITPLDPPPEGTTCIVRKGMEAVAYHIPHFPFPPPPTLSSSSSSSQPSFSTFTANSSPGAHTLKTTIHLPRHSHWTSGLHYHTTHTEYLHVVKGCISVRLGNTTHTVSAAAGGTTDWHGSLITPGLVILVPRYARHAWMRADHYHTHVHRVYAERRTLPADWSVDVVVEEWTDPADISKPMFFFNLNAVIRGLVNNTSVPARVASRRVEVAKRVLGGWWVPFQLFVIFWELDNWPVFVDMGGILGPLYSGMSERGGTLVERGIEHAMTGFVLFAVSAVARILGVKGVTEERTPEELWKAWAMKKGAETKND